MSVIGSDQEVRRSVRRSKVLGGHSGDEDIRVEDQEVRGPRGQLVSRSEEKDVRRFGDYEVSKVIRRSEKRLGDR
jgi:hypothetical protein